MLDINWMLREFNLYMESKVGSIIFACVFFITRIVIMPLNVFKMTNLGIFSSEVAADVFQLRALQVMQFYT